MRFGKTCLYVLGFVGVCWDALGFVQICWALFGRRRPCADPPFPAEVATEAATEAAGTETLARAVQDCSG